MKTLRTIFLLLLIPFVFTACEQKFIDEPTFAEANITIDDNIETNAKAFKISSGNVDFKVSVTGNVSKITITNRYSVTGIVGTRSAIVGDFTVTNGVANVSFPFSKLRLESDPALTFANRGANVLLVDAVFASGKTERRTITITFTNN